MPKDLKYMEVCRGHLTLYLHVRNAVKLLRMFSTKIVVTHASLKSKQRGEAKLAVLQFSSKYQLYLQIRMKGLSWLKLVILACHFLITSSEINQNKHYRVTQKE